MKNQAIQTKEKILAVSAELFLNKGFDRTTMQDIVNELGMSKGAIFYHFRSKEEIFEAVLHESVGAQLELLHNEWLPEMAGKTGREKLSELIDLSVRHNSNVARIMVMRIHDPRIIVGMMQSMVNLSAPIFAELLHEGVADGSIQTDFSDELSEIILLLLNTYCDPVIFECDLEKLERRLKCLQSLMRAAGADFISDEHIAIHLAFTKNIYGNVKFGEV